MIDLVIEKEARKAIFCRSGEDNLVRSHKKRRIENRDAIFWILSCQGRIITDHTNHVDIVYIKSVN